MKWLIGLILIGCFTGCAEIPQQDQKKSSVYKKRVRAKTTYYFKKEDRFGNKIAMGGHAKEGVTVAMRRSIGKLGTEIFVPIFKGIIGDGKMMIQDRGRDVEKLKASHKKCEVVDVYLECKNRKEFTKRVAYLENKIGQYVDIFF